MMRDGRYPAGFAAATSVASATIGPLVPPSIAMIFYALIANASVGALFLAGLAPAALMAAALMVCIAVIAGRRNFPAEPPLPWRSVPAIFARALLPLALPAILLGIIYSGIASPTEAAAIAAAYALVLAFAVYRSMSLSRLIEVIADTVIATATIGLIMAGAFVFNYAIANEGVPHAIRNGLVAWNLSPVAFLICVNVMLLLLAILIDEITILLVIVPLLVPVAQSLGIDVVHFGVVIVLNMMVGLALPPHGLLLFVMNGLTGTPLGEIFREMPAFVATMLAVLIATTLCPALALTVPRLLGYAAP
jgi:tripartite ATP-independent transporter DctM subunit